MHVTTDKPLGAHAVVMGGSLTGLIAARALADHFERVTVVERDRLPEAPEPRKGVPQSRHVHVLLKQGERIVDGYFPGLRAELVREGSELCDMAGDTKWFYFGDWKKRFRSGMEFLSQSRGFLEWKIRGRVFALPNVRLLDGHDVSGFTLGNGTRRISGVRVSAERDGGAPTDLAADLVVDASGRGTRTPQWLDAAGFGAVPVSEIRVDVGYASRFYLRPANAPGDWRALFIYPRFPETRLGVLLPVEGNRWLATLVGWYGDHPPGDDPAFLEWTTRLAAPDLTLALKDAEPLSPIALHKFPSNLRRRYEQMRSFPDGLAVIGDAACSFNPIYGQGMATGAIGGRALGEALAADRGSGRLSPGFSRRFQARLGRLNDNPWLLTTSEDFRNAATPGRRPFWMPLLQWYTARIHRLTWTDEETAQRFLEVMHLTKPPTALFHPRIVLRALGAGAPPEPTAPVVLSPEGGR